MTYLIDIYLEQIKGKTLEEAKNLIAGRSYELRIDNGNLRKATTNGANKAVFVVLNKEEKIVSYTIM